MMDDYDYIGNYFKGALSLPEMKRFDEKIQEDPVFAGEVAFYCSTMLEIKNQLSEEKKDRFRVLYNGSVPAGNHTTRLLQWRGWWPKLAAAAVILFAVAGTYLYFKPSSPKQLADTYIKEAFNELPVNMDNREDSLKTGIRLYNEKKFAASLQVFENILQADSSGTGVKELAGIVSLQLGNYDKALKYFEEVENDTGLQVNPGKFYCAITLMERNQPGDRELAKKLLNEVIRYNLTGKKQAVAWLDKL